MITWRDLSAPSKVITLLITIVLVWATLYLTAKYVYGDLTITSTTPNTTIELQDDIFEYPLPHNYRLKPGNHQFILYAPGYLARNITLKVYPFWHRTVHVSMVKDLSFENGYFSLYYDYKKQVYIISPKIAWDGDQNPQTQMADSWNEYEADANKAISYIKSQGVEPKSIAIEWWAREWWPKGKSVAY